MPSISWGFRIMVSVNIVVLLVGSDEFHMNRLVPVGNRYHQPEVVALDVEHHAPILEDTGAFVSLLDFGLLSPDRLLGLSDP